MEKIYFINYFRSRKLWKFKNTLLLLLNLALMFFLLQTIFAENLVFYIKNLGYLGAFLAGIFFVSTFSIVPASVVLFFLAKELNPFYMSVVAGVGTVFGDYLIFRFLKDYVFEELRPFFRKLIKPFLNKISNISYFMWILPILGAIIIASPFPDEIGISLMGLSKIKSWQFLLISFILNSLGILFMIMIIKSF